MGDNGCRLRQRKNKLPEMRAGGSEGHRKEPVQECLYFFPSVTPIRDRSSASLCAVNRALFALFEMSLPSSEMQRCVESVTWNRSLIPLTDAISQMAHV